MPNDSTHSGPLVPENSTPTLAEDDAFDAVLQTLVVGITGLAAGYVRPRWQPVAVPQPPVATNWCAIGVIDEDPDKGRPFVTHDGAADSGAGADYVQVNDTAEILASFYGLGARGTAMALRMGLMVAQNREALTLLNMGLVGMPSAARYVPEIVNEQTQRRVDISFAIRRANVVQVPVRNLLSFKIALVASQGALPFQQSATHTLP